MRTALLGFAALLLLAPPSLAAAEDAPPAEAATPSGETPGKKPDLSVPPPSLESLLPPPATAAPAPDPALEAEVRRRRTLLSVHQAAGLATWGLMGTTVVVGRLNYVDLYGGGGYTQKYRRSHRALAGATAASFAFTGILALAAPEPYAKPVRLDTATIHKVSMGITTLGLVGQIALGIATRRSAPTLDQRRMAQTHEALGYATFGAMTIGAVTLLF